MSVFSHLLEHYLQNDVFECLFPLYFSKTVENQDSCASHNFQLSKSCLTVSEF